MPNEILPIDGKGRSIQLTPATTALARLVSSSISSSTQRNLNAATTYIRILAENQKIYLKWGTTAVTSSNFDEVIPAGQLIDLFVPDQSANTRYTAFTMIEATPTATVTLIEK